MTDVPTTRKRQRVAVTIWWWFVTVLTLVVLDDLTFGPFFWAISRVAGPWWAVAAVYAVYLPAQLFLVERGMRDEPGRIAAWFLRRLDLRRRYHQVSRNESHLRTRVVGVVSALVMSVFIAGVLPPLILWREGFDRVDVRRVAVLTSLVYATEFALLHGLLPAVF